MPEWPLYQPVIAWLRERGFRVASQVTDAGGTRFELDVVGFTPELDDVRIVEVKRVASERLADQCRDRLRYARRVYAAVPDAQAGAMVDLAEPPIGVIAVGDHDVEVLREASATDEALERGEANRLRRRLRTLVAEGEA